MSIDEKTGLIKDDPTEDSWKGIKVFREFVKKYGLEGLTVVGLTVDYETPLRFYDRDDRGRRSLEEVYEDREKYNLTDKDWVECMEKWQDLQFNVNLEQERINLEIKSRLVKQLSAANMKEDDNEIERLNKSLNRHETTVKSFAVGFDRNKELEKAVTKSGYKLSRIERELLNKKNSKFRNHGDGLVNPNKLGLTT